MRDRISEMQKDWGILQSSLNAEFQGTGLYHDKLKSQCSKLNTMYTNLKKAMPACEPEELQIVYGILANLQTFFETKAPGGAKTSDLFQKYVGDTPAVKHINAAQIIEEVKTLNTFLELNKDISQYDFNVAKLGKAIESEETPDSLKQLLLNLKVNSSPNKDSLYLPFKSYLNLSDVKIKYKGQDLPVYEFILKAGLKGDKSKEGVILDALQDFNEYAGEDLASLSEGYENLVNFAMQNKIPFTVDQINFKVLSNPKTTDKLLSYLEKNATKEEKQGKFITQFILKLEKNEMLELSEQDSKTYQSVVKFMLQAIKKGIMSSAHLEYALSKDVISARGIKQIAQEGLLTQDMLNIKLQYGEEELTLYEVMMREQVSVGKGSSAMPISQWFDKQFPDFLQSSTTVKHTNRENLKFRDLEVEQYKQNYQNDGKVEELSNMLLRNLKLDIKEERTGDTVLNHFTLQNHEQATKYGEVFNEVVSKLTEKEFTKLSEHFNENTLWYAIQTDNHIRLSTPIGKSGMHPFLVAHDKAVEKTLKSQDVIRQILFTKVNDKGQPVAKDGITLLEYTSKHQSQTTKFKSLLESEAYTAQQIAKMDISVKKIASVVDDKNYAQIEAIFLEKAKLPIKTQDLSIMLDTAIKQGKGDQFMDKFIDKLETIDNLEALHQNTERLSPLVDFMIDAVKRGVMDGSHLKKALESNVIPARSLRNFVNAGAITQDMLNVNVTRTSVYTHNGKEVRNIESKPLYMDIMNQAYQVNGTKVELGRKMINIANWLDKQFPDFLKSSPTVKHTNKENLKFRDLYIELETSNHERYNDTALKRKVGTAEEQLNDTKALNAIILENIRLDIKENRYYGTVLNHLKLNKIKKVYKEVVAQLTESEFAKISQYLENETLKEIITPLSINQTSFTLLPSVGKKGMHPFLVADLTARLKMRSEGFAPYIKSVQVNDKGQPVAEDGITLLEYTFRHKAYAEHFTALLLSSTFQPQDIAKMDIPSEKFVDLLKEGVNKKSIQNILTERVKDEQHAIHVMCELLAAGQNNPKLKDTYKEIYNACQDEIEATLKITDAEKRQANDLFSELISNPRAVASFLESEEFKNVKTELGVDKARMLLAYFVTKEYDKASKDLSTMRHLNIGYQKLTGGSLVQQIYDMLTDLIIYLKGNESKLEKFENLKDKLSGKDKVKAVKDKTMKELLKGGGKAPSDGEVVAWLQDDSKVVENPAKAVPSVDEVEDLLKDFEVEDLLNDFEVENLRNDAELAQIIDGETVATKPKTMPTVKTNTDDKPTIKRSTSVQEIIAAGNKKAPIQRRHSSPNLHKILKNTNKDGTKAEQLTRKRKEAAEKNKEGGTREK